jgi:predicted nuclease of predicted toxin-antitoxin system
LDDERILEKAYHGNYILITNDKDFGELVFRMMKPHKGVILLRLKDERPKNKIAVLKRVLELYSDELFNNFTVVTEKTVRIIEQKDDVDSSI